MEPPEYIRCPITLGVMRVPVIAPSGRTFELKAITQWFNEQHSQQMNNSKLGRRIIYTCPVTRTEFGSEIPDMPINYSVVSAIDHWSEFIVKGVSILPQQLASQPPPDDEFHYTALSQARADGTQCLLPVCCRRISGLTGPLAWGVERRLVAVAEECAGPGVGRVLGLCHLQAQDYL
eukprot:CAMPEP_0196578052 /NCGR_PEP_ID=MMETSP1081-20130531/7029_1 /TAXON_ID=36882 /ORGANISM="Pyramimonas amylifera, Strain CCMP720" /LENGTH=176 /DNA_ID=CAMNT_0041897157 /DNA_START=85 /DNA_END=612 /DNA_ORIENTATION=-